MKPVTVMIPVYNAEAFINETIDSVLCQSFTDFELLLPDDGSTDRSAEIIRSYTDSRIRYVKCAHDFIGTLNRGLSLASGKYIAFMDHDDIMLPGRLHTQYDFMESRTGIAACGGYMIAFGKNSGKMTAPLTYPEIVKGFITEDMAPVFNSTGFVRRETLRKYHIDFKRGYSFAADLKFWSDMVKIGKVVNIPENLIRYRTSDTQTSLVTLSESRKAVEAIYQEMIRYMFSGLPEENDFVSSLRGHFMPVLEQMIDLSFFSCKGYRIFVGEIIDGLCANGFLNLNIPFYE
jgi:glycosyltransferase involved in cell wall biosynthesis